MEALGGIGLLARMAPKTLLNMLLNMVPLNPLRENRKCPEGQPSKRLGDRIRGTLGDIDPLNKVPV